MIGTVSGGGGTAHVVAIDIVRPDDDAFTQPLFQGRDQVGEGVSSEVSSEVVPGAADLAVVVAPRRSAERAGIALAHVTFSFGMPSSISTAKRHIASIIVR